MIGSVCGLLVVGAILASSAMALMCSEKKTTNTARTQLGTLGRQ